MWKRNKKPNSETQVLNNNLCHEQMLYFYISISCFLEQLNVNINESICWTKSSPDQ